MSGFNSGKAVPVSDLAYDFTAHGGGEGTIPEPSAEIVQAYFKEVRGAMKGAGIELGDLAAGNTAEGRLAIARALGAADEDKLKEMEAQQLDAVVGLCGGTPSKEEIEKLPARVQQAFFGWLVAKFSRPPNPNGDLSD